MRNQWLMCVNIQEVFDRLESIRTVFWFDDSIIKVKV